MDYIKYICIVSNIIWIINASLRLCKIYYRYQRFLSRFDIIYTDVSLVAQTIHSRF